MSRCVSACFQLESFMEDIAQQVPFMQRTFISPKVRCWGGWALPQSVREAKEGEITVLSIKKQTLLLQDATSLKEAKGKQRFLHFLTRDASFWGADFISKRWGLAVATGGPPWDLTLLCWCAHPEGERPWEKPFPWNLQPGDDSKHGQRQITEAERKDQGHVVGEMQRSQVSWYLRYQGK